MLTLYAVLCMNLIKFNELRSCLYGIWINSKQLIEFESTQLGITALIQMLNFTGALVNKDIFCHDTNNYIKTTYGDIMTLRFFINIQKLLSLMTSYANPRFFRAIY